MALHWIILIVAAAAFLLSVLSQHPPKEVSVFNGSAATLLAASK
jgi:cytochrome b561